MVSFFLVSTIILNLNEPGSINWTAFYGLIKLIIATYVFSIVSLLILKFSDSLSRALTYGQIIWDLVLVTLLLIFTGGINSPYSFLYFLSIINASVFLARREAYYTASLCGILYGGIIDLQFFGKLPPLGLTVYPVQHDSIRYVFYTVLLNIAAYYLTAFLAGHLSERARASETALHEKEVDYEELERLNTAIVASLNSGLLTINGEGRIRVFNPYAEIVTGISQNDAYDRLLVEVMPGFAGSVDTFNGPVRDEIEFADPAGNKKVLGFKSVPLTDKDNSVIGVIVDFQDLTQYKQMENKLKRADRLAAVGELSARMAHEIRNPLASISGAVQLIAQSESVCTNDKQLLGIVERETDRLNGLIRDFLEYARPNSPAKVRLHLRSMIAELSSLLQTDSRFSGIRIDMAIPENAEIDFDLQQCKQVFWNLLVNAAEAMPSGGQVSVRAEIITQGAGGDVAGGLVKIEVADTGMGMDPQNVKNVFEPFFTTKSNGTGLGLATVYRIVEGHGGIIVVDSKPQQGTKFTLFLPQLLGPTPSAEIP